MPPVFLLASKDDDELTTRIVSSCQKHWKNRITPLSFFYLKQEDTGTD